MKLDVSLPQVQNRLILWVNALSYVERSLLLVVRAKEWSSSNEVIEEIRKNGSNDYNYYADDPYSETRKRPFPILFECDDIVSVSMTSAVIYYCQLLTSGNAFSERISSNSRNFTSQMWKYLISFLEQHGISKEEVDILNESLLAARDGMIAHADASQFIDRTDDNGKLVSFRSYEHSWGSINQEIWLKICYLLKNEIMMISSGVDDID